MLGRQPEGADVLGDCCADHIGTLEVQEVAGVGNLDDLHPERVVLADDSVAIQAPVHAPVVGAVKHQCRHRDRGLLHSRAGGEAEQQRWCGVLAVVREGSPYHARLVEALDEPLAQSGSLWV
ncbi:MAG: hypothetical protein R2770_07515 [Acidimicrobiales bacterium]